MTIYCLDTMVLIWAIKGQASLGQEENIQLARSFLHQVSQNRDMIIIPAPVIAELLANVPPDKHILLIQNIEEQFRIEPFDLLAAQQCAKLWWDKQEDGTIPHLISQGTNRQVVKVDCQVVSIALASGANKLVSYDPGVKLLGSGKIETIEIPKSPSQLSLI